MGLNDAELARHIDEQIYFLVSSSRGYDEGHIEEAKRIASTVRTLVHQTVNSHALLAQVLDLSATPFVSMQAEPIDEAAAFATGGLVYMGMGESGGWEYTPSLTPTTRQCLFDEWWNDAVYVAAGVGRLTRKDCVLMLANKGGGAHVDPRENNAYRGIAELNTIGWTSYLADDDGEPLVDENGEMIPEPFTALSNPLLAIVRAIGEEVLLTTDRLGYRR